MVEIILSNVLSFLRGEKMTIELVRSLKATTKVTTTIAEDEESEEDNDDSDKDDKMKTKRQR
jgi:hypothetical protein